MVDDRRSRLNPNAPVFIPTAAFGKVGDFSPDWWDLVKTSPCFRDFWLTQHQEDDFITSFDSYYFADLDEFPVIDGGDDELVGSEDKTDSYSNKETVPVIALVGIGMDAKALLKSLNPSLQHVSKLTKRTGTMSPAGSATNAKYCGKKKIASSKCMMMSPKCTATRRIHQPRR